MTRLSKLPRPNKRTTAASSISPLLTLYHHSPSFLPLAPAALPPHINNAFAPQVTYKNAPEPTRPYDLMLVDMRIHEQATLPSIKKSMAEAQLDLKKNWKESHSSYGFGEIQKTDETLLDSWKEGLKYGSEPPLRKRVRRTLDALHGTECGGQAGEWMVKEKGDLAKQLNEDLQVMREERDARRREEERRAEEELAGFTNSFEEENELTKLIERR